MTKCCHDIDLLCHLMAADGSSGSGSSDSSGIGGEGCGSSEGRTNNKNEASVTASGQQQNQQQQPIQLRYENEDDLQSASAAAAAARTGKRANAFFFPVGTQASTQAAASAPPGVRTASVVSEATHADPPGRSSSRNGGTSGTRGVRNRVSVVTSLGSRSIFRPDRSPAGSGDRCTSCTIEATCPYSALKIYLQPALEYGHFGWPVSSIIVNDRPSIAAIEDALLTVSRWTPADQQRRVEVIDVAMTTMP